MQYLKNESGYEFAILYYFTMVDHKDDKWCGLTPFTNSITHLHGNRKQQHTDADSVVIKKKCLPRCNQKTNCSFLLDLTFFSIQWIKTSLNVITWQNFILDNGIESDNYGLSRKSEKMFYCKTIFSFIYPQLLTFTRYPKCCQQHVRLLLSTCCYLEITI